MRYAITWAVLLAFISGLWLYQRLTHVESLEVRS
jgi:hypothetical protein